MKIRPDKTPCFVVDFFLTWIAPRLIDPPIISGLDFAYESSLPNRADIQPSRNACALALLSSLVRVRTEG